MIVAWCICVQDKWYLQSEPPPNGNSHIPESFTQSILLPPPLMEWVWDKGKDIFWSKPLECVLCPQSIFSFLLISPLSLSLLEETALFSRGHMDTLSNLFFSYIISHLPILLIDQRNPTFHIKRIYPTFSGNSFIRQANFGCDHFGQPFQIVSLEHCEFWESKAYHTNKENKVLFEALVMVFSECWALRLSQMY